MKLVIKHGGRSLTSGSGPSGAFAVKAAEFKALICLVGTKLQQFLGMLTSQKARSQSGSEDAHW